MCGCFTQRYTWREVHDLYDRTGAARNLHAHYNIAPTDTVDVVKLANGGTTELVPMSAADLPSASAAAAE
jgi:putative SOS response-associated peptidase YedK